jgi:hypothetical protein
LVRLLSYRINIVDHVNFGEHNAVNDLTAASTCKNAITQRDRKAVCQLVTGIVSHILSRAQRRP